MARRSKLTPERIRAALFTVCTECGYKIQPSELLYLDWKRCRCPQCRAELEPVAQPPFAALSPYIRPGFAPPQCVSA